jgi:hypothetical protein
MWNYWPCINGCTWQARLGQVAVCFLDHISCHDDTACTANALPFAFALQKDYNLSLIEFEFVPFDDPAAAAGSMATVAAQPAFA